MTHVIAVSVAAFLLWLAANRLEWFRETRRQYSQTLEALFAELCQAHELSRADRTLLSAIAQTAGPKRLCSVFVDPRIIQQFAESNPGDAESCQGLCRTLFGSHAG